MHKFCLAAVAAAGMLMAAVSAGNAQTRTWVSGVGADENPCSRTSPCKTFAGALGKTADKGEISVIDSGAYGPVTITKSISIISEGAEASILGSNTNGIVINSPNVVVNLQGLFLEGGGTGISGIRIIQAAAVHIRNCTIHGFNNAAANANAIEIVPSTSTKVYIQDCKLTDNRRGILVQPSGAGAAEVFMKNVSVEHNTGNGVRSVGATAKVWMNNSTVIGHNNGLSKASGGVINSYGNNVILNNATDGTFSGVIPLQ